MSRFLERAASRGWYAAPSSAKRGLGDALQSHKDKSKVGLGKVEEMEPDVSGLFLLREPHTLSSWPWDLGYQTGRVSR